MNIEDIKNYIKKLERKNTNANMVDMLNLLVRRLESQQIQIELLEKQVDTSNKIFEILVSDNKPTCCLNNYGNSNFERTV